MIDHGGRRAGLSETSDDYPRVVTILSDGKTGVIVCYAGIQWIVQRGQGEQWHSRSFCHTKEALIRCCGGSTPELDALPDRVASPSRRPPTCKRWRSEAVK